MRTSVINLFMILSAAIGIESAPACAAERNVFRYGTEAMGGALVHDYANRWVEFVGSRETYSFEEERRSDDTIELIDRSRDVGLRVHANRGEFRLPNSTVWQPWQQGKWISMDALPRSIRFVPADQKIRLAYLVPTDRQPIARYEQKIRVVMRVVADVYADLRTRSGRPAGFTFETNARGEPIVHLIRSEQPAQYFNDAPAYDEAKHYLKILGEIPADVGSPRRHMIMLFAETYEPGPAPVEWRGSIGRGGHISADGGVAIISAWILRDEFCATSYAEQKRLILDATPIVGRTSFGTRQVDAPRFEFIEDGFGAAAHELGHALGLPHDARVPRDVMGQGFRNLRINYLAASGKKARLTFSPENARLLAVSRYLEPETDRTDNSPPTAEVKFQLTNGSVPGVVVRMKATDDRALKAAVFFDPKNDSVIGGAELKGKSQAVELKLPLSRNAAGRRSLAAKQRGVPNAPKTSTEGEIEAGNVIMTFLADAGGNIAVITAPVQAP